MAALINSALSARDRAILQDLRRVRLLTGGQVERLHFADLATGNARGSARRRTMSRLMKLRMVTALPRRVGGVRAGSAGLVYTLDARAYRSSELWMDEPVELPRRVRRPWTIGWPFVQHTLGVAELYVRLRERERAGLLQLKQFDAEPASWYASGHRVLKPDAYAVWLTSEWEQYRWIEVDRSTRSLPSVRRQLAAYVDLAANDDAGPGGVLPKVLVTVATHQRQIAVAALIAAMPAPASQLISVQRFADVFTPPRPPP